MKKADSQADDNAGKPRETHLRLRLLTTANIFPDKQLQPLIDEADEIRRVIGAIIVSSKRGGEA